MLKVYLLIATYNSDFAMIPFANEAACKRAITELSLLVTEAECYPVEMLLPRISDAPEMAPLPPRKPT